MGDSDPWPPSPPSGTGPTWPCHPHHTSGLALPAVPPHHTGLSPPDTAGICTLHPLCPPRLGEITGGARDGWSWGSCYVLRSVCWLLPPTVLGSFTHLQSTSALLVQPFLSSTFLFSFCLMDTSEKRHWLS